MATVINECGVVYQWHDTAEQNGLIYEKHVPGPIKDQKFHVI